MSTGTALFPGINDVFDQLDRIFTIRGLPDPQKWPEVVDLPNWKIFQFTPYIEMEWDRVGVHFESLNNFGENLLTNFLKVSLFT